MSQPESPRKKQREPSQTNQVKILDVNQTQHRVECMSVSSKPTCSAPFNKHDVCLLDNEAPCRSCLGRPTKQTEHLVARRLVLLPPAAPWV
jgi:hypothetical protein